MADYSRVILAYNPVSGKRILPLLLPSVRQFLNKKAISFVEVSFTNPEKFVIDLKKVLNDGDLVLAFGGDGTVNLVINAIILSNKDVALGIVPAGSTNLISKYLGINNVFKFRELIENGKIVRIDVGEVLYGDNFEKKRYFFAWFSTGFDEIVLKRITSLLKFLLGKIAFLVYGLFKFIFHRWKDYTIIINGRKYDASYIIVGQLRYYATRIYRPLYLARLNDGYLDLFFLTTNSRFRIIKVFSQTFLNSFSNFLKLETLPKHIKYFKIRELEVYSKSKTHFQLDGDFVGPLPVKIRVLPLRIKVLSLRKGL